MKTRKTSVKFGMMTAIAVLAAAPCETTLIAPASAESGAEAAQPDPAERRRELSERYRSLDIVPVSVDFAGGTVAEYVEAVNESLGLALGVAIGDARDMEVGRVELRGVPFSDAMRVLNYAVEPAGRVVVDELRDAIVVAPIPKRWVYDDDVPTSTAVLPVPALHGDERARAMSLIDAVRDAAGADLEVRADEHSGALVARGTPEAMQALTQAVRLARRGSDAPDADRHNAGSGDPARSSITPSEAADLHERVERARKALEDAGDRMPQAARAQVERGIAELERRLAEFDLDARAFGREAEEAAREADRAMQEAIRRAEQAARAAVSGLVARVSDAYEDSERASEVLQREVAADLRRVFDSLRRDLEEMGVEMEIEGTR